MEVIIVIYLKHVGQLLWATRGDHRAEGGSGLSPTTCHANLVCNGEMMVAYYLIGKPDTLSELS